MRYVSSLDLDNIGNIINSPDPINLGDAVNKNFIQKYYAESLGVTTTTSTTVYTNKVTLTTPSLPVGDYIIEWSLKWGAANASRGIKIAINLNAVEIVNHINGNVISNITDTISMRKKITVSVAGVQTIILQFLVGSGATTISVSEAALSIKRFS